MLTHFSRLVTLLQVLEVRGKRRDSFVPRLRLALLLRPHPRRHTRRLLLGQVPDHLLLVHRVHRWRGCPHHRSNKQWSFGNVSQNKVSNAQS